MFDTENPLFELLEREVYRSFAAEAKMPARGRQMCKVEKIRNAAMLGWRGGRN